MDAKTILNPKWWLLAFGVLFLRAGLSNYLGAEGSADTAYPGDYTARDVFYEQTFGLFTMVAATLAIVTSLNVSGRGLHPQHGVFRGHDGLHGALHGRRERQLRFQRSCHFGCCVVLVGPAGHRRFPSP